MTSADGRWWSPWRDAGAASLLHVDLRPDRDREAQARELLDAEERRRWDRLRLRRARRQFALCRAALRIELGERLGCDDHELSFGYLEHGKPFARVRGAASPVRFNVSHSGEHGLIGFTPEGDIGVDLEGRAPDRNFDGVGKRVYGPREQRLLAGADGPEKARVFYRLWSLKEALIKALGTGFSLSPARFEVPEAVLGGARSAEFRFPHAPRDAWRLLDLGESRFAAAAAYRLTDGGRREGPAAGAERPGERSTAGPGPSGAGARPPAPERSGFHSSSASGRASAT